MLLRQRAGRDPPVTSRPPRRAVQPRQRTARHGRTDREPGLLHESIVLLRHALDETPPSHPRPPRNAVQPRHRAARHGRRTDRRPGTARRVDRAAPPRAGRDPGSHPDRPAVQSNLASALAEQTEDPGLLHEAIMLLRQALDDPEVTSGPPRNAIQPRHRAARHGRTDREPGLLHESIVLLRHALDETPPSHPDRPAMQSNLATALRAMAEQTENRDCSTSRSCSSATRWTRPPRHIRTAPQCNPTSPPRCAPWPNRPRTGTAPRGDRAPPPALDETPRSHPDRPAVQSNLDSALRAIAERPSPDLLHEAIMLLRQALDETPRSLPTAPPCSPVWSLLAGAGMATRLPYDMEPAEDRAQSSGDP